MNASNGMKALNAQALLPKGAFTERSLEDITDELASVMAKRRVLLFDIEDNVRQRGTLDTTEGLTKQTGALQKQANELMKEQVFALMTAAAQSAIDAMKKVGGPE